MKKLLLIKLGGSLITDKDKPFTARVDSIQRLAEEIQDIRTHHPDYKLIIAHGSGSFGHYAAEKKPNDFEYIQTQAKRLHDIVRQYFDIPLLFGQVIDNQIVSSETLLLRNLMKREAFEIESAKIIFLTDVDGLMDKNKVVYPLVSKDNREEVQKSIQDLTIPDVTGGMLHKLDTAIEFSKMVESVCIANGKKPHILRDIIQKKVVTCTKIVF